MYLTTMTFKYNSSISCSIDNGVSFGCNISGKPNNTENNFM